MPQGQLLAIIPYRSMVVPVFLSEYPKGVPFIIITKRKKVI